MSTETEAKRSSRSAAAIAVLVTLLGGLWLCAATWSGGAAAARGYDDIRVGAIWVPVGVREEMVGAGDPRWRVTLCLVEWDAYWRRPHEFGKFKQVQQASSCGESKRQRVLDLAEAAYAAKTRGVKPLAPAGFIFQESRVGSTLLANILAAVPHHLVYSEGLRLPTSPRASRAQQIAALRDYVSLLGAPARVAASCGRDNFRELLTGKRRENRYRRAW